MVMAHDSLNLLPICRLTVNILLIGRIKDNIALPYVFFIIFDRYFFSESIFFSRISHDCRISVGSE